MIPARVPLDRWVSPIKQEHLDKGGNKEAQTVCSFTTGFFFNQITVLWVP